MKNIRLNLIVIGIKKALDINNDVHIIATNLLNEDNQTVSTKITIIFPKGVIHEYLNKWNAWKTAYKYRKR